MIHPKVLQEYKKNDQEYHKNAYNKHYDNWLSKITDPDTKEPYSPITEQVHIITRVQDINRREWILWSRFKKASDALNNDETFPVSRMNSYQIPKFRFQMYRDSKTDKLKKRVVDITGTTTHYEVEWSIQAAEELLAKGAHNQAVQLIVCRDWTSGVGSVTNPVQIEDWNEFLYGKFDDICRIKNPRAMAIPMTDRETKEYQHEREQHKQTLLDIQQQKQHQQQHTTNNSSRSSSNRKSRSK